MFSSVFCRFPGKEIFCRDEDTDEYLSSPPRKTAAYIHRESHTGAVVSGMFFVSCAHNRTSFHLQCNHSEQNSQKNRKTPLTNACERIIIHTTPKSKEKIVCVPPYSQLNTITFTFILPDKSKSAFCCRYGGNKNDWNLNIYGSPHQWLKHSESFRCVGFFIFRGIHPADSRNNYMKIEQGETS